MNEKIKSIVIPTIAMRGLVLFPNMVLQFDVGREKSLKALDIAMEGDRKIFLVAQKDMEVDEPSQEDLYSVGVVATISQIIKTDDRIARVIVKGEYRAKSIAIINEECLKSVCFEYPLIQSQYNKEEIEANVRVVKSLFEKYCLLSPKMPKELVLKAITSNDAAFLSEFIAENLTLKMESKQQLLEESSIITRLSLLAVALDEENEIASIESEIYERVREKVDKNQRDYYLREQLKAIEEELEGEDGEEYSFEERIDALPIEDKYKDKLFKDVKRLERLPSNSNEYGVITSYLETVLELPWFETTEDIIDIKQAEKQLDKDHFGLKDVKTRILETLAVRAFSPEIKGQILCLAGPPGVGKTSIASSIAKTIGRKFARISLGGVRDESDIRGHRKTYVGAMEGRIISAIETAGTSNPV
ncbi:MAG: LON peptidase substrate-binding domain-containing protein, partial [Oscillospiraceae bacterium]